MIADVTGLLDYQVTNAGGLIKSLRAFGAALDGGDPGIGKTYELIAVARELNIKPHVICPKSVVSAWHRVARELGGEVFAINYEALKGDAHPEIGRLEVPPELPRARKRLRIVEAVVELVGPMTLYKGTPLGVMLAAERKKVRHIESRRRFVWNTENVALIYFDEGHRCKGQSSLNGKMMIAAKRQGIPAICASATAALDPLDMKALGYLLGLHNGVDFWKWARRNGCYPSRFGGLAFSNDPKHLLALHKQIYPSRGVRTRRSDIPNFPPSQIRAELFDIDNCERIDELYREMASLLDIIRSKVPDDPERNTRWSCSHAAGNNSKRSRSRFSWSWRSTPSTRECRSRCS